MNKKRMSTAAPLDKSGEPARTYFCVARGRQKIMPTLNILQKTIYAKSGAKTEWKKPRENRIFSCKNVQKLTLGSLFDGIGGFPLAAALSGITPVWAAEIDPACVAVTRRHFPDMLHFGDVSEIDGAKIPPVDIITFGSPCQDLSVAGKRAGLDGARSGLFTEAIRIIYEMREATHGVYPASIVWENVPGAFSSRNGRDFQTVLKEITKADIPMPTSGGWANAGVVRSGGVCVAWRVLDAQYWGVPQRRKRIYLIGSFGDRSAEQILFKPDCVRRYLAPRQTPRKGAAADPDGSAAVSHTVFDARGNGNGLIAPTVTGDHNNRVTDYTGIICYRQTVGAFKAGNGAKSGGIGYPQDVTPALTAAGSGTNQEPSVVYAIGNGQKDNTTVSDKTGALTCMHDQQAVIYAIDRAAFNEGENAKYDFKVSDSGVNSTITARGPSAVCYNICSQASGAMQSDNPNSGIYEAEQTRTLDLNGGDPRCNQGGTLVCEKQTRWIARRLTPLECERLQGYPDGWTVLPKIETMTEADYDLFLRAYLLDKRLKGQTVKKTPTREQMVRWHNRLDSDSTRYRQLGNSLAIPCALREIGGIAEYMKTKEQKNETQKGTRTYTKAYTDKQRRDDKR